MPEQILTDGDQRRAAQFLRYVHPERPNLNGANTILREAHEAGRGTQLTLAVAAVAYGVTERLGDDDLQSGLAEFILAAKLREDRD